MKNTPKFHALRNNRLLTPIPESEYQLILDLNKRSNNYRLPKRYRELYQIQATRDIHTSRGIIPKGTLGGFIENAYNLNPFDESWIDESSLVMQQAMVTGNSYIGKNVICRWAFTTPDNSDIEADHTIVIDHRVVYSSKHKAIVQLVGQDDAIEKRIANREQFENEYIEWFNALKVVNNTMRY